MMFKCIKSYQGDIVPPYLETIFDCYKSTHQYQTRNSHRFSLPGYRTTTACNSFIYRAIKYYNNLPAIFHDISSLRVFKQMLKNHSMWFCYLFGFLMSVDISYELSFVATWCIFDVFLSCNYFWCFIYVIFIISFELVLPGNQYIVDWGSQPV